MSRRGKTYGRGWIYGWLSLVLLVVVAGCSSGGANTQIAAPFAAPPQPTRGATPQELFFVNTPNYFTLYTLNTAPFEPSSQLADGHYPVPVGYETAVPGPEGFDLQTETERSVHVWAQADPRVTVISNVPSGNERVKTYLVETITYNGIPNILGLTKLMRGGSNPYFEVYLAVKDPINGQPLPISSLQKTLVHEVGHVLGLGHAPDERDLMYYKSTSRQGATERSFLTYGDAMAIWSTLSNRRVNWVPDRPTITLYAPPQPFTGTRAAGPTRVTDAGGDVVCVYTRP